MSQNNQHAAESSDRGGYGLDLRFWQPGIVQHTLSLQKLRMKQLSYGFYSIYVLTEYFRTSRT